MSETDWSFLPAYIPQLEQAGLVTRTYRRLDLDRQSVVLAAILAEASEHGPSAVNIQRVARRAGVSVGSLYQYFGDRDRMVAFAVELCVRYTLDMFQSGQAYLAAMPLRDALQAYLYYGIEWSRTQAGLLQLFARAAYQGDPELSESLVIPIASAMRAMVTEILQAAQARGELRPDIDLQAATRLVHAFLIAASDSHLLSSLNDYFQVIGPDVPPERSLSGAIDLILHGIANLEPASSSPPNSEIRASNV